MLKTTSALIFLEALRIHLERSLRLGEAVDATLKALRSHYPEARGGDPNGDRQIGCKRPPGLIEETDAFMAEFLRKRGYAQSSTSEEIEADFRSHRKK
jgi:hypothetical protein